MGTDVGINVDVKVNAGKNIGRPSYNEIMHTKDIRRLREGIDPLERWFTDNELSNILKISGGRINQAVIKCTFGIEQRAKKMGMSNAVIEIRNFRRRFEAGLIKI